MFHMHTIENREAFVGYNREISGEEQASNRRQKNVDALPHPVSGKDIAHTGRASERLENGIEQSKAVNRGGG